MRIVTKLTLSFLIVALLIFLVGYYSAINSQRILQVTIGGNSLILANETADKIDRHIYSKIEEIRLYSHNPVLLFDIESSNNKFEKLDDIQKYINEKDEEWTSGSNKTVTAFMQQKMNTEVSYELRKKIEFHKYSHGHSIYGEIFATNKYGAVVALSGITSDYRQNDEKWWQSAKENGLYVSPVGYDKSADVYSINISIRIDNEHGDFIGVIKAILNIEEIFEILKELKQSSKYGSINFEVFTKDGKTIYKTKEFDFLRDLTEDELQLYSEMDEGFHVIHDEKELIAHTRSVGYRDYKGLGWMFVIRHNTDEIFYPVIKLRNRLLFISFLVTIFAVILGLLISRSISHPLSKLKTKALEIGSGNFETNIDITSKDEVGDLAGSFNKMAKDLKEITASRNELNREIEERRHAEEENTKLEQQLRQAQKMEAVGQLAGGIAHDFNNIIMAIVGFGNIIKRRMEKNDPNIINLNHMLSSAERATYLTKSLLLFSRKQVMDLKPTNLNDIVIDLTKFLERVIGADISLKTIFTETDQIIMADSVHIDQVLMNLAANARDAMPNGGVLTIETESQQITETFIRDQGYGEPGEYALLSVGDTGTGMDKETTEKIFEPFFTTKEAGKGTGLGLSVTYGIVKQLNGFINIYSEPGEGTLFKIYLPITKIYTEETETTENSILPRGTETILLAEDDEMVRNYMKEVLEEYGYKVIESIDGEDAIKKFIENKDRLQLSILDIVMPRMDGKKVYDEINKIRPDMKTLFISGYTKNIIDQKMVFEKGMHFVSKPIQQADLLNKVRELIDSDGR